MAVVLFETIANFVRQTRQKCSVLSTHKTLSKPLSHRVLTRTHAAKNRNVLTRSMSPRPAAHAQWIGHLLSVRNVNKIINNFKTWLKFYKLLKKIRGNFTQKGNLYFYNSNTFSILSSQTIERDPAAICRKCSWVISANQARFENF